jgi:2',3'-cyclic-nucleotide 2'-phosphodiesterase (5'-nucleotidase family)
MSHHSLVALHWEGDQLVPETELPYETVNYDTEVTILHTNDFHSCIDSFADGAGGLARIATTVRRAQANGPTLMVDAGDSVFGSPTLWSTQGAGSTARLRGAAGYHLAALGNHDLEHGAPGVRELLEGGYRLVASNLEFADADLAKQIAPAYMTSVDGLRIGFTGVTTLDTLALVPRRVLDGVQFIDPYESTVRTVKALEPLVVEVWTRICEIKQRAAGYGGPLHSGVEAWDVVPSDGPVIFRACEVQMPEYPSGPKFR